MSLAKFTQHLRDPYPAFRCYAAGDRSKRIAWTARVTHEIGDPAGEEELQGLRDLLGEAAEAFVRFATLHDGVQLYADNLSDTVGVQFYRVAELERRTAEMKESMDEMGFEEEDLPEWLETGVAIGEMPQSGNYLVVETAGENVGKIFYADHDDRSPDPLAGDLEELLGMIVNDPCGFLYERGCYARYSDGKTDKQWIPAEYLADGLGA